MHILCARLCVQVTVFNGDEVIQGCPLFIRAMPEVSEIKHSGMEPCAVGSIVEVQVSIAPSSVFTLGARGARAQGPQPEGDPE